MKYYVIIKFNTDDEGKYVEESIVGIVEKEEIAYHFCYMRNNTLRNNTDNYRYEEVCVSLGESIMLENMLKRKVY